MVHLDEDRDRGQPLEAALVRAAVGGGVNEPLALSGLLGERGAVFDGGRETAE